LEAFTLFELNEYIRRVIALNFEAPIWVQCEISQIKDSRGHYYLELVQKDENTDQVIAQSSAALWSKNYWFIKKKHGAIVDDLLEDGVELKIKVNVTFHEKYGLKLIIEDIDTSFTIGQLEIQRRKIIERLQAEGLLELNSNLKLPPVIQNIAVISSATAAGLQDFLTHLRQNAYQYAYRTKLFESAVQGTKVTDGILTQLAKIKKEGGFDCIAIIRGGGSRIDLAAFDDYDIAQAVSKVNIPVLIGIGHDIDQTVLDLAGHTSLKTPTAVADFLIQHNLHFEAKLQQLGHQLQLGTKYRLENERSGLIRFSESLIHIPRRIIDRHKQSLLYNTSLLKAEALNTLTLAKTRLAQLSEKTALMDPIHLLRKGYSYTTLNDQVITTAEILKVGDKISTRFAKGKIESEVKKIDNG
jgi:exodeoxyribonuclease VII large subunit